LNHRNAVASHFSDGRHRLLCLVLQRLDRALRFRGQILSQRAGEQFRKDDDGNRLDVKSEGGRKPKQVIELGSETRFPQQINRVPRIQSVRCVFNQGKEAAEWFRDVWAMYPARCL
jgi:hypothetical protein